MKLIYRISDSGYNKVKPDFITNEICLKNFVEVFLPNDFTIKADNISEDTKKMILKYVPEECIQHVKVGHGAGTFNLALDLALTYNDNEIVYFIENDYLHTSDAKKILEEGFDIGASFVSLYDHPDKYLAPDRGGNPYCDGGAEDTRVYLTDNSHWKITNSTTMTFAAKVKTLKESYFGKKEVKQDDEIDNVAAGESAEQPADLSNAMAAYSAAISKTKDIKLSK